MSTKPVKVDPRIRRTRQMLADAFRELLKETAFDKIGVNDIVKQTTLNRATFYDHFPDKFALLASMMQDRFKAMIDARVKMKEPGDECEHALKQIVLATCEFVSETSSGCQKHQQQFEPMVEAQVKAVIQEILNEGLRAHKVRNAELKATMFSWAVAGAAFQWNRERKISANTLAKELLPLLMATLHPPG